MGAPELKNFSLITSTADEGFVVVKVEGADVGTVAVDVETGEERWSLPPLDIYFCGSVDGNAVAIVNGSLVVIDGRPVKKWPRATRSPTAAEWWGTTCC